MEKGEGKMKNTLLRRGVLFGTMTVTAAILLALGACGSSSTSTSTTTQATTTTTIPATTTTTTSSGGLTTRPANAITINLAAQNMAFDQATLTVPAGAKVTIIFQNKDSMPHNFALYNNSSASQTIFKGDTISGPNKTVEYSFNAPDNPGEYFFRCDVHPSVMTGKFIVTAT
jgi:plastocyanin